MPTSTTRTAAGLAADFWRAGAGTTLPDGTTDTTERISRNGNVGIGSSAGARVADPVSVLDVGFGTRTGTDPRGPGSAMYVTSNSMPALSAGPTFPTPPNAIMEWRHSNETSGIGLAYNGLYATGSAANGDLIFQNRGGGIFRRHWQALNGPYAWEQRRVAAALGDNQGFIHQTIDSTRVIGTEYLIKDAAANGFRRQWTIWAAGAERTAARMQPAQADDGNTELWVGENQTHHRKLLMWFGSPTVFYGMGVVGGTMSYSVPVNSRWSWRQSDTGAEIMALTTGGRLTLPLMPTSLAGLPARTLYALADGIVRITP